MRLHVSLELLDWEGFRLVHIGILIFKRRQFWLIDYSSTLPSLLITFAFCIGHSIDLGTLIWLTLSIGTFSSWLALKTLGSDMTEYSSRNRHQDAVCIQ